jgi:uncharacterized protein YjbI with pentapeptide repeats
MRGPWNMETMVGEQEAKINRDDAEDLQWKAMANPEHLAKLKEGVEAWNQWRVENPNVQPDLIEADLRGANLTGADFNKALLVWNGLLWKDRLQKAIPYLSMG